MVVIMRSRDVWPMTRVAVFRPAAMANYYPKGGITLAGG